MRICLHLQLHGLCSKDIDITQTMLNKFNSSMYLSEKDIELTSALETTCSF
jgi:hypothetical protein